MLPSAFHNDSTKDHIVSGSTDRAESSDSGARLGPIHAVTGGPTSGILTSDKLRFGRHDDILSVLSCAMSFFPAKWRMYGR